MTESTVAGVRWTAADVPDLHGRLAIVTGASSGIGLEAARVLARHGARVVLACRDADKARDAQAQIRASAPDTPVQVQQLDLASLASVRKAADELIESTDRIDLLINNAGQMWPPRSFTEDGFEQQFGVNHLGHFALTGLLLDHMRQVPGSRVVTVSSGGHRRGTMEFEDLNWERTKYNAANAYGRSKLANLMFTYELQRRLAAAEAETIAVAAHPGMVPTPLMRHAKGALRLVVGVVLKVAGQRDAALGALPTLRAATDPAVRGGEYYGPDGRYEAKGYPVLVKSSELAHDAAAQQRLWQESERLTGVSFAL
jgi:NAD(P)-dependent dehydrogenase (short-subunit alcohol dehydrogenase family)